MFMASDEGAGGQVEDQTAIHLLIEVEVEVVEAPLWVAKLGLLGPSLQQAITATSEFIRDQTREEVDGGHGLCFGCVETGFEYRCGRLATVAGRREAVFVSGGPVLECDTSRVSGVHAPAAADRFWGRGCERRVRPTALGLGVRSSLGAGRSRRLRLRHNRPDAPPVGRVGSSEKVPGAVAARKIFLRQTWRRLAAW